MRIRLCHSSGLYLKREVVSPTLSNTLAEPQQMQAKTPLGVRADGLGVYAFRV